jgi:hypothetical protein
LGLEVLRFGLWVVLLGLKLWRLPLELLLLFLPKKRSAGERTNAAARRLVVFHGAILARL